METNEKSPVQITGKGLVHLNETRKWAMFISILGLIFIGLGAILVPVLIISSKGSGFFGMANALPIILVTITYFFPVYFLFKFSIILKKAIQDSDSVSMETSFNYLKLHYRFLGMLVIVVICIYALATLLFVSSDFLKPVSF